MIGRVPVPIMIVHDRGGFGFKVFRRQYPVNASIPRLAAETMKRSVVWSLLTMDHFERHKIR